MEVKESPVKSYASQRRMGYLDSLQGQELKKTLKSMGVSFSVLPMKDSSGSLGEVVKVESFGFVIGK